MQSKSSEGTCPIAIVGMAFRFPGDLADEQSLWLSLKEGRDLVGCIGPERWSTDLLQHPLRAEPGRSVTFSAGVLSRIDEFDAGFFGISPREAAWLDPQQRMLLELCWEAMENAGAPPARLAGSDCAVFVGISGVDYGMRGIDDMSAMSAYSMTGNTLSIAANRLSYVFDLRGPSMAVDTACSSSLVAVHQACSTLRAGEASTALVGGVNLLLHPYPFVGFTKASMLSAAGRCRAFDAEGDGYVRAEGGAVLMLKPLESALADGDPIQSVILASGINADGGRKTGITIPSIEGQADLLRAVLRRSGLNPADVDYIEAHGTGTAVGDPIESAAIGEVYGRARSADRPLPIGSVKTNLGHLESASGMAGLVKAILVLKNRALPPSLHLETPNPHIDFAGWNLDVVNAYRPLPEARDKKLVVGVNSFGFGGANAHVLLQEFPAARQPRLLRKPATLPLFLSARTVQALRDLAGRYAELLRARPLDFYDIAYAAAIRREHLERRLVLTGGNAPDLAELLEKFAQGETVPQVVCEDAIAEPGGVAFIYSGNGSQWLGMGRKLLAESPRFAELMSDLDAAIAPMAGFSILDQLRAEAGASRLDDTAVAQPLLFCMQVAVTTLLRQQGVTAQAVAGHSVGEVAAAWAAGALPIEQAMQVIVARSAAQALTRGAGRMAAVGLSEEAARELLAAENLRGIEIAGINSPNNVTLSGSLAELDRAKEILTPRGVFFVLLDLDYAFHSRHMDPIEPVLVERLAACLRPTHMECTLVSTVTGDVLPATALDARYWWHNVRRPVRFAQAIAALAAGGCRVFVEIGPHAILQRYITECLAGQGVAGRVLPTLRRDDDGAARIEEAALRVHLLAEPKCLESSFPVPGGQVRLPNYPWQRERHWHPRTSEASGAIDRRRVHPLLGWRVEEATAVWENVVDLATCSWLADHKVAGAVVLPGAAYVELALAAAREWFGETQWEFENLDIIAPIVFDGDHARSVRFELAPRDGGFLIRSRQRLSNDEWVVHAAGRLLATNAQGEPRLGVQFAPAAGKAHEIEHDLHYRLTRMVGLDYGPSFQGLQRARLCGNVLEGQIALPEAAAEGAAQYLLHPVLLDCCFQSLADFFQTEIEAGGGVPLLPVRVGRLRCASGAAVAGFRAVLKRRSARSVQADFQMVDADGGIVATLSDCRFRAATLQRRASADAACWRIAAQLKPLALEQRQSSLPDSRDLVEQLNAWFVDAESRLQRSAYFKGALPLCDALIVAFAQSVFGDLFARRGEWLQQVLADPTGIDESIRPCFQWLARNLRHEGLLVEHGGVWRLEASEMPPAQDIWRTLLRDYPACASELVLAGRVGVNLAAWLCGEVDVATLTDSLWRSPQAEALYEDSPGYLGTRLAVRQILATVAANWPAHRRLRVLEIGRGVSDLVADLAATIPVDRTDYVLAHGDEELCTRLQSEYHDHPAVQVARLAGEGLALEGAGTLPDAFDVIILRHWLHLAANPVAVLAAARQKLAQGGLLLVAERHPDLVADLLSGLDAATRRVTLEDGALSNLLAPQAWEQVLVQQGYGEVQIFREPASEELPEGSYLVLAKRPVGESAPAAELSTAAWLLLCDAEGTSRMLADRLQRQLESRGQRVIVLFVGTAAAQGGAETYDLASADSAVQLLTVARNRLGLDHVVYLAGLIAETQDVSLEPEHDRCRAALHLVQAIERSGGTAPRLWLVTSGGALAEDLPPAPNPLQAALWGFGRVVMNENPALACTLIDLAIDPTGSTAARRLHDELLQPDGETEIVLSANGRFVLRLERLPFTAMESCEEDASRVRLDFHVPGQLRNLVWLPQPERPLGEDEVEVRVAATGLNFRDVMYVMGLLPDEAVESGFAGATLGLEFSGVVTRVGSRTGEFSKGDCVVGFGAACFASHVVTHTNALAHKPADWSFEAAATVPTAFFTVYYALKHLANLQAGERILIHGAAGGVGIAAVQLAVHLGAEVYATAGSDEKRDFVRLLGADHVFDSRTLSYADQILSLTNGEGVDVVLNSLAGEAIRRNLRILKPFGRFLELGKRDFFENTPIGLRPFKDNISYFGIDADQLLVARPALAARLFREMMTLFRESALFPLPYRTFPADRVVNAFRTMQQSRQIGKVVVCMDNAHVHVERRQMPATPVRFRKDATYLVTGGLTGFGFESARWLAERGAGNLVLAGRRGSWTPGSSEAISALESLGARVKVVSCDVSDRASVRLMLDEMQRELPPLAGLVHAAMVMDDALIGNLDAGRMCKVVAPKLFGAWHLHELTLDIPLEHFILYSSVTTLIGNPGQAGYVAANGYLEGLAAYRHALGLPATCVGWGPIGDAGYLSRNPTLKDNLASRLGAQPLSARSALDTLDRLLARDGGTIAVADFDWRTLARLLPSAQGPRFASLRRQAGGSPDAETETEDFHSLVAGKSADEVRAIVQSLVAQQVAQILCINVDRIDPARSLHDLGMDSLMGVELALGMEQRFGVRLPAMMLTEGPTVERVSARIVERLLNEENRESTHGEQLGDLVSTLAAQHNESVSAGELAATVAEVQQQVRRGTGLIP